MSARASPPSRFGVQERLRPRRDDPSPIRALADLPRRPPLQSLENARGRRRLPGPQGCGNDKGEGSGEKLGGEARSSHDGCNLAGYLAPRASSRGMARGQRALPGAGPCEGGGQRRMGISRQVAGVSRDMERSVARNPHGGVRSATSVGLERIRGVETLRKGSLRRILPVLRLRRDRRQCSTISAECTTTHSAGWAAWTKPSSLEAASSPG